MSAEQAPAPDPRIRQAVDELESLIKQRYPTATFDVAPGAAQVEWAGYVDSWKPAT